MSAKICPNSTPRLKLKIFKAVRDPRHQSRCGNSFHFPWDKPASDGHSFHGSLPSWYLLFFLEKKTIKKTQAFGWANRDTASGNIRFFAAAIISVSDHALCKGCSWFYIILSANLPDIYVLGPFAKCTVVSLWTKLPRMYNDYEEKSTNAWNLDEILCSMQGHIPQAEGCSLFVGRQFINLCCGLCSEHDLDRLNGGTTCYTDELDGHII